MKKPILALVAGVTTSIVVMATPAVALHGTTEPVVPAHQHWINGQQVGPDACSNGMSLEFDHFHMNIHFGKPGLDRTRGDGDGLGLVTATRCP